jgi:hypothetical protein
LGAVPAHAAPRGDKLEPGEQLLADQSITSADGRFTLIMQSDGNVVLYQNGVRPLWESATLGSGATRLTMQGDGNLVAYSAGGTPVWASGTVGSPAELVLQSDGNLVIYRLGGRAVWATGTHAASPQNVLVRSLGPNEALYLKQSLTSSNRQYALTLEGDGNLVVRDSSGRKVWAANTAGSGADRLIMQSDGNLVLYRRNTSAVWASNTINTRGGESRLTLDDNGSLSVTHGAAAVWTTKKSEPPVAQKPSVSFDKATYVLTGWGFLPNTTVYIRVVRSDFYTFNTQTTSDASGQIRTTLDVDNQLPVVYDSYGNMWFGCAPGQTITFTANDNRWDPKANSTLWSNGAVANCG